MELQLEDYWKVTRPRRAKPVGGHLIPLKFLDPLVDWVGNLGPDSKSFQVLLGGNRELHLRHLQSKYPFRGIVRAPTNDSMDLVGPLFQVLRDLTISNTLQDDLDFVPPSPLEWDLIWCLVAIPHTAISSNLLDVVRKDKKLIALHTALEELRFEAFERRVMISVEEGIQRLVGSLSKKKRDRLSSLMFLSTMACENGLLNPFIVYLDTKDTTNGLLEVFQTCKDWEPYGSPLKLLVGCEEHAKFIPVLHKHLNEGLEWLTSR